jgi:hypothetical protein
MTMRTYAYYACANGHKGIEKTSENDQPYSKMWESVTLTGMRAAKDSQGKDAFECTECGLPMAVTDKP